MSTSSVFADRVGALGTENAFKIGADIRACEAAGMKVIKLNIGEPDFNSPEHINRVACREIERGNSHYCDPQGLIGLREVIARQVSETRGLKVTPDRICVHTGAKPPISYSMLAYVNPGDEVVYPSPGFPIYESWVTFVGAKAVPLHLEESRGFSFTADQLEPLLTKQTKLIIINSPSNPTGGVLGKKDLKEIAGVIRSKCSDSVRIYSDEVYEYILFDGESHSSIAQEKGMAERTIIVSCHSKSFAMTGWRLGYAVLPTAEEADIFKHLNINIISCTPPFIQEGGREAYANWADSRPAIDRMVAAFQERRDVVVDTLNKMPGVTCAMPKGAFYVFPNIAGACKSLGVLDAYEKLDPARRKRTSPSTLMQMFLLYRYGVATMDRNSFGRIGAEGRHYLRLSLATELGLIREGLERMSRAFADNAGFASFVKAGEHLC